MRTGRWSQAVVVLVAGALAAPALAVADKGGAPHEGSNGVGRDGVRDEAPAQAQAAPAPGEGAPKAPAAPEPKRAKHAKQAHPAHPAHPDHPSHPAKPTAAPAPSAS